MTREDFDKLVKKFSMNSIHYQDNVSVISVNNFNKISETLFDDLKSRTCENCKYFVSEDGYPNTGCIKYAINFKDFGCNKFERKEDDK